mmetsp:Transcript_9995/g.26468  ORF Transcript_9995/g.26468 Transcript_9995/m.26468 type:complete len:214 (+) Transcript_9995:844-1485(+)
MHPGPHSAQHTERVGHEGRSHGVAKDGDGPPCEPVLVFHLHAQRLHALLHVHDVAPTAPVVAAGRQSVNRGHSRDERQPHRHLDELPRVQPGDAIEAWVRPHAHALQIRRAQYGRAVLPHAHHVAELQDVSAALGACDHLLDGQPGEIPTHGIGTGQRTPVPVVAALIYLRLQRTRCHTVHQDHALSPKGGFIPERGVTIAVTTIQGDQRGTH